MKRGVAVHLAHFVAIHIRIHGTSDGSPVRSSRVYRRQTAPWDSGKYAGSLLAPASRSGTETRHACWCSLRENVRNAFLFELENAAKTLHCILMG